MAEIKKIEEEWIPRNSTSMRKPSKLARYSFGVALNGIKIQEDSESNDYRVYLGFYSSKIKSFIGLCINNQTKKDKYLTVQITFTNGVTALVSNYTVNAYSCENYSISIPSEKIKYINLLTISDTSFEKGQALDIYYALDEIVSDSFLRVNKNTTPLNIFENKKGTKIYEDLHIEVFVKTESIVKDLVNNFDLSNLYNPILSVENTALHSDIDEFVGNHNYKAGELIHAYYSGVDYGFYVCLKDHISANNFYDDYTNGLTYTGNWSELNWSEKELLYVNKNIEESNYSVSFPYVAELLFKNLWGCDVTNNLNLYVKKTKFHIDYNSFLNDTLSKNDSSYNKFYSQGLVKTAEVIFGDSFDNDSILGNTKLDNYFRIDRLSNSYTISNPYDHSYDITPFLGMPYFKEKDFQDAYIKFILFKKDVLGNEINRIVNLPLHILFFNNLIKAYWKDLNAGYSFYSGEYMSSTSVYKFSGKKSAADAISATFVIWCPNVEKLTLNTSYRDCEIHEEPKLQNKRGQFCELYYSFKTSGLEVGDKVKFINVLEYSDGENYDKFTLHNECTII